jgi:cystathionine gamma-synthase
MASQAPTGPDKGRDIRAPDPADLHPETIAVTAGRPRRDVDAPFNQPVVFASTYVGTHEPEGGTMGYGRDGNPTWQALEDALGRLEGGRALTFASGMAAAHAIVELLPPGATVVLPVNCYLGVSALIDQRAALLGWTVRRVAEADTAAVLEAANGADLVWLESPANPTIEVADLPAIGAGLPATALLVVDNTFATPLLQRPLAWRADVVLHSATKLISGHSDALLGALVVRPERDDLLDRLEATRKLHGAIPGPMETYLVLRGLRTLPVRLERAQSNAVVLAERLATHPGVRRVRYPGLPADPGHEVASRTMAGFGSLIAIELADAATANSFIDRLRLWAHATSLGGVESSLERRRRWAGELKTVPEGLVRLSVGIEHVEDLWDDLAQALPEC